MAMADRGARATQRRLSAERSEKDLRYEELLENPDIVNDGYTTYVPEYSSEEEAPTQKRVQRRPEGTPHAIGPPLMPAGTTELEDSSAPIYLKVFGDQRKPRYADIEAGTPASGPEQLPAVSSGSNVPGGTGERLCTFEIMHNWTQDLRDEEFVAIINVVKRPDKEADRMGSVRGHIGWLHAEEYRPSLQKLEDLFTAYLAPGLAQQICETTSRLLARVKGTAERKFVGGKFLFPGPIRYDARLSHGDNDDHPCTFFSFPYLAVGDFGSKAKPRSEGASRRQHSVRQGNPANQAGQQATSTSNAESSQSSKDSPVHPVRALLQSRYRLESTRKRDDNQSITTLSKEYVKDCIQLPPGTTDVVKGNKWKSKIYVPQFWGLSISGNTMITSGPISAIDLHSSALMTRETTLQSSQSQLGPSIIRINLDYQGKREPFIYPVDRCNWYFGLLNKERRILSTLGDKKDKPGLFKYKLYRKEGSTDPSDLITSEKWVDVLREETSEQLDLWMEREVPQIELTADSDDQSNSFVADQLNDKGGTSSVGNPPPGPLSPIDTSNTLTVARTESTLLRVPSHKRGTSRSSANSSTTSHGTTRQLRKFTPFLQWPLEEDTPRHSGRKASQRVITPAERVRLWLDKVLRACLRTHSDDIDNTTLVSSSGGLQHRSSTSCFMPIAGSSEEEVQQRLSRVNDPASHHGSHVDAGPGDQSQTTGHTAPAAAVPAREVEQVFVSARRLLRLFVPRKCPSNDSQDDAWDTADHDLIRIYWGLQDRIIASIIAQQFHATELTMLLKSMSDIIGLAELLHRGVSKYKNPLDDGTPQAEEMVNVESAVMQQPIPTALENIIYFLFNVAKYVSGRTQDTPLDRTGFARAVGRHLKGAVDDLVKAQDYLIAAAEESAFDKGLGPVVTPEAIVLLLLERLSRGVYKNGSIDVMDLYAKIVETIASRVEARPSRHLLLEIYRVSEELEIIHDVLQQQKKFFEVYRQLLNPASFDHPTLKRRSRFPFEENAISRNQKAVNERISDCEELQQRANRLADRNVRLVETYQDDNNKTLLIFTIVTITFLPLSFVTGFFGMNVVGINPPGTTTVKHFWVIAVPVTVGVVVFSLVLTYWGTISRKWNQLEKRRENKKSNKDWVLDIDT